MFRRVIGTQAEGILSMALSECGPGVGVGAADHAGSRRMFTECSCAAVEVARLDP